MSLSSLEKHNPEAVRSQCKATLQTLLTVATVEYDRMLRNKLRLFIRLAHETGFSLKLSDSETELGGLMSRANIRSATRGWL